MHDHGLSAIDGSPVAQLAVAVGSKAQEAILGYMPKTDVTDYVSCALVMYRCCSSSSRGRKVEDDFKNTPERPHNIWVFIVMYQAALDLDLKLIRSALSVEIESAFRIAQRVYLEGAFSRSVAELFLDDKLEDDLPAGSEVVGPSYGTVPTYTVIRGTTHVQAPKGTRVVEVRYDVRGGDGYEPCRVGANPRTRLDGCK